MHDDALPQTQCQAYRKAAARPIRASVEDYPPETLVLLYACQHGEPGRVLGTARGKVVVEWRDLGTVGRHPPGSLLRVNPATRL